MIGIARRILDAMLLTNTRITNEILTTLTAKIAAIINARPLVPISTDGEKTEIFYSSSVNSKGLCNICTSWRVQH